MTSSFAAIVCWIINKCSPPVSDMGVMSIWLPFICFSYDVSKVGRLRFFFLGSFKGISKVNKNVGIYFCININFANYVIGLFINIRY